MSISPDHINQFWLVVSMLVYGITILIAIRTAEWWRLRNQRDLNVLLFAILGVFFFWMLKAEYNSVLNLHLLGTTVLALMFGWAFATLSISIVIVAVTLLQAEPLLVLPLNSLLTGVLPVLVSYHLFRIVDRHLPNHFFIYIFICTFFGAALSMASVISATSGVHILSGAFDLNYLSYNYFQYGLLLMFPEAFITGTLMSIFVAYRPQWVTTFDDRRYLHKL